MGKTYVSKYAKERDAALLSLDKKRIQNFMLDHGVDFPNNETVFWAGVHKAILHIRSASVQQRFDSLMWLMEHGFSPEIY